MRDNHVCIFDGETWILKDKDEIIQQLIDVKSDILENKFNELEDKLSEDTVTKFKRFLENKDLERVSNKIKRELKSLLYNNKHIPQATRKLIEIKEDKKKINY